MASEENDNGLKILTLDDWLYYKLTSGELTVHTTAFGVK